MKTLSKTLYCIAIFIEIICCAYYIWEHEYYKSVTPFTIAVLCYALIQSNNENNE